MKLKWTEVMEAFHKVGFTNKDYRLLYSQSVLDKTIGFEKYTCGESVKEALESLGIEIEVDMEENK